jgi:hypothetical protein
MASKKKRIAIKNDNKALVLRVPGIIQRKIMLSIGGNISPKEHH